jgi:3-oxoacyl-[acyl-carrier protein] reductase
MDLGLKGKIAVVTGSGSQIGFGKGIALALAKEGCDIVAADIDLEGAKKTAAEVEALGRKALAVKVDISDFDQVDKMAKAALDKFGKVDILVNNAGTSRDTPFLNLTEQHWHFNVEINLKGTWYCTKALLPQMLARKKGKIVNLSSAAAFKGFPTATLYSAAKAGIVGFTISLAAEVGPSGINVNCIAPGMGDTGLMAIAGATEEMKKGFASSVPMRKMTTPQDIANAVLFLVSDSSVDITGQTIHVDGGDIMH